MLTLFATALATTLIPASHPIGATAMAESAHHSFRLPADLSYDSPKSGLSTTSTKACPTSQVVTVCANRADRILKLRVPSEDVRTGDAAGPHLRALRIQPSRCVNPVEEGLRCIRPVPAARISLGN